jgi:hypothetical protein
MATTTAKGFNSLSAKQQERQRALLSSLDIDVKDTLDYHISTHGKTTPVQICTDLHRTVLIPKIKVIKDVRMMKQFGGIPDERFESGESNDDYVVYPPPWNERYDRLIDRSRDYRHLIQTLSAEQRTQIRQALTAWLIGFSKQVLSYETIINAVNFPQYGAVFAGNTLCVAAGTTVVVGPGDDVLAANPMADQDPYLVSFSDVCIEDGGQLQFQVPTQMTITGTLTKKPAGGCNCPPSS